MIRRKTRQIFVGNVQIGSEAPLVIQSMTNTKTSDAAGTIAQIKRLSEIGCQVIRLSVDNEKDAEALDDIIPASPIPVIADIQFDYRSAIFAAEHGINALRLNPGLISNQDALRQIAAIVLEKNIPIRVGANSGSVKQHLLSKKILNGLNKEDAMAELLCDSALQQCEALEKYGVKQIKVALKSSDLNVTVKANKRFANRTDYPLHIGITEAGLPEDGIIKSAIGIGALLIDGIGDTIRVSLTAAPEEEIIATKNILKNLHMYSSPEIVSCPTCGRTEIDLRNLTQKVKKILKNLEEKIKIPAIKIAVMGCPVNGPGEARNADIGLAGCKNGRVIVFKHGEIIGDYSESDGLTCLTRLIHEQCERK